MRAPILLACAVALGLAGFAVYGLLASPNDAASTNPTADAGDASSPSDKGGERRRTGRKPKAWKLSPAAGPRPLQVPAVPKQVGVDPVEVEPSPAVEVARAQLEGAMKVLREAVEDKRLEPEAFDEHYRAVNDAFVAYSRAIDTSNLTERDQLEDEYQAMMEHLREVRVKGGKREPRPVVQPRIQPD